MDIVVSKILVINYHDSILMTDKDMKMAILDFR